MMNPTRIGILGAGMVAEVHLRALQSLRGPIVVGLHARHAGRVGTLATRYGVKAFAELDALLREVDMVAIATPSGTHGELAATCAHAGVHVLCEKPLETTPARVDVMIAAHAQAGTRLGALFQHRFDPLLAPLREAVRAGRFGRITSIVGQVPWWRDDAYYAGSWHGTWALDGGGALMNQTIHIADTMLELGGPVTAVTGLCATLGHAIEAEDTGVAALQFASGALGLLYGTTASWPGRQKRLEVTGTRGTVAFEGDGLACWRFVDETSEDEAIRERFNRTRDAAGGAASPGIAADNHARAFAAFVAALEGGAPYPIDGAEGRRSVALIDAIYRSNRTGQSLRLDETAAVPGAPLEEGRP